MNCQDTLQALPRYVDSRLPGDELALVRSHLDACAGCRAERAGVEQADALIAAALSDHPFGDAAAEELLGALPIRAAAARRAGLAPQAPPRVERGRPLGLGLAAAAAAVLAALLVFPRAPEPAGPDTAEAPAPALGEAADAGLLRVAADGATAPLGPGEAIREGDRLVAVATPAVVALEDGTRVALHADTEVALLRDADGGLRVALADSDGELFCDVAKRRRPFRVAARNLTVEVMGTRFLVHQGVRVSRVVVEEGRVAATFGGDRRILGADDAAEAHAGFEALELLRVTARDRGPWVPADLRGAPAEPTAPAPAPAQPEGPLPTGSQPPLPAPDPVDESVDLPVGDPRGDAAGD